MGDKIQELIDKEVTVERQRCLALLVLHLPPASIAEDGEHRELVDQVMDGTEPEDLAPGMPVLQPPSRGLVPPWWPSWAGW